MKISGYLHNASHLHSSLEDIHTYTIHGYSGIWHAPPRRRIHLAVLLNTR